jgi:hypothetical protein
MGSEHRPRIHPSRLAEAGEHLRMTAELLRENLTPHEFRLLVLVAIAAAAVRFSTPSLA